MRVLVYARAEQLGEAGCVAGGEGCKKHDELEGRGRRGGGGA